MYASRLQRPLYSSWPRFSGDLDDSNTPQNAPRLTLGLRSRFVNFYTIFMAISVKEIWSLFTFIKPNETAVFSTSPNRNALAEEGPSERFDYEKLTKLRGETIKKLSGSISKSSSRQPPGVPRVRFTIRELCESLEGISTRQSDLPYRERVLVDFLSAPQGRSFWGAAAKLTNQDVSSALVDDVRGGILTSGLSLEQMQQNSVQLVHEVVIHDLEVSRSPVVVTVRASPKCALRAGWLASGLGSDVDRLQRLLSLLPQRLREEDSAAVKKLFEFPSKVRRFLDPSVWGRWTAGMREATRLTVAEGVRRLTLPLSSPTGPLQRLRVEVETRPAVTARVEPLRILPQRLSFSFHTPGYSCQSEPRF